MNTLDYLLAVHAISVDEQALRSCAQVDRERTAAVLHAAQPPRSDKGYPSEVAFKATREESS